MLKYYLDLGDVEIGAVLTAVPASPAPYFVTTLIGGDTSDQPYRELTVRNALTGAATAVVPSLKDAHWSTVSTVSTVSAGSDPWTFLVMSSSAWGSDLDRIYRLTTNQDGTVRSLNPVESLRNLHPNDFALSPDGDSLAIDTSYTDPDNLTAGITIMNLRDGRTRILQADQAGRTDSFSWSADGRHLAYRLTVIPHGPDAGSREDGIWVLDLGRAGFDLLADSHQVTTADLSEFGPADWTLSADGRRLYCILGALDGSHSVLTKRVVEIEAATGRQPRVLRELHHRFSMVTGWSSDGPLTLDPSGRWLLASDAGTDYYRIDLSSGAVSRLPTTVNRGHPNELAW